MMSKINKLWSFVFVLSSVLTLIGLPENAQAQEYPNRPIKMIIPFSPGGASDLVGRILQTKLGEVLGQPIIIENKPGASGNIGMEMAAKSAPDGYTLFLGNIGTMAINPALYPNIKVNPLKDFIPITEVVDVPSALVTNASFPVNTVAELITYLKANPGKFNYASPGSGSANRLQTERFMGLTGTKLAHIPYKGGAGPATVGMIGGETQMMFVTLSSAQEFIKSGRLKGLAVTSPNRMPELPNVPTISEAGFKDLTGGSWQILAVPAGTPRDIVNKLYTATVATMMMPEIRDKLERQGAIVLTSKSPEAAREFLNNETQRWGKVVKDTGATPD
ncbi:tripartite tricarboxylate transporter substrate binding protein [Polynucleobacter sp. UK-Mo-2m-Kol15]|uniref:Bug family tripartite tricarboxylate transporter substrate binding protein n=1 Tax=Polynucleobacter sp. UK-Mo-2m-Kol15 TaxID=2576916 RepID=UPI001C0D8229|nr:tripartite tricarboxylate transporter substrate binding protein [Polynucleobacter sp. UK-Mo-2m-Kol15]MBU3574437.1 tripartite tricarboxylate transporter substrate binding protein [Polynucleobacter sp. UK-Mo-2m-Kol15]